MTAVAVLGAGAGGLATAAELTLGGHEVALWHPNPARLAPYRESGVTYRGALGEGVATPALVTDALGEALARCEVAVVTLPAFLHDPVFTGLATAGRRLPVLLSPGHTGGALHLRQVFCRAGAPAPAVAELSTLPYVARVDENGAVNVTCCARHLRCGVLPGGDEAATAAAVLFSSELAPGDVLASSLANVNLVLHPPGAVLGAAWIEATAGAFTFYVEGLTPGVARVAEALDAERRAVALRFGHALPTLVEEMSLIGTVELPLPEGGGAGEATAAAISSGAANRSIAAPGSFAHRYYREDFSFGLAPFLALADVAGEAAPIARSLLALGGVLAAATMPAPLDAAALGIEGCDVDALLAVVRP
ncbi:MAG: NAD/NADP octopine/nopaline dehydrogenase family protein [Actinomycetota bacterium]|nr:NAD/NADP octopine/nopaline dehydrogenase family protein [Actinomycetota bacterium]